MRGEHGVGAAVSRLVDGIIPACAGSTTCNPNAFMSDLGSSPHARGALEPTLTPSTIGWDHPRMRGEHSFAPLSLAHDDGIIPACAGSTLQAP